MDQRNSVNLTNEKNTFAFKNCKNTIDMSKWFISIQMML